MDGAGRRSGRSVENSLGENCRARHGVRGGPDRRRSPRGTSPARVSCGGGFLERIMTIIDEDAAPWEDAKGSPRRSCHLVAQHSCSRAG